MRDIPLVNEFRRNIADAARDGDAAFFTWFDSGDNVDATFVKGAWDFAAHIAQPVTDLISAPETKTALEIGHGGGRLLAAAGGFFGQVIGIDVHAENDRVQEALERKGLTNCTLLNTAGDAIPLPDESVDLVYSFIVLQHLGEYSLFEQYLREAYRTLKPGGLAVLYFGRKHTFSLDTDSKPLYAMDRFLEPARLPNGYRELAAKANDITLLVSLRHARKTAGRSGFETLKNLVSFRRTPSTALLYGRQNGLVLRKPVAGRHD